MSMDPRNPTASIAATESRAIFDFARENLAPTLFEVPLEGADPIRIAAVPRGHELRSIRGFVAEYADAPPRRMGHVTVTELASFIDHAKRFADPDSALFADDTPSAPKLVAIHNYHRGGPEGTGALARFGDHRTIYPFPLSDEWNAWRKAESAGALDQRVFAEFLEDRIVDVLPPSSVTEGTSELVRQLGIVMASPEKLVELATSLAIRVDSKVKSSVNLATGEREIVYEETHGDQYGATKIKIPTGFVLAIPVFRGGPLYQLPVRLRYRVSGPTVKWIVQIARGEAAFRDAFRESCEEARTKTGLPLFYGRPD